MNLGSFFSSHNIRGVILDIDDTLYLERDYVRSGFAAVGASVGLPAFGDDCWQYFLDGGRGHTFDVVRARYPQLGLPTQALVELYRCHRPSIALCPDAAEFLDALWPYRVAFLTDGPLASQRAKCLALRLLSYVDFPLYTAEIGAPKPSPTGFVLASFGLGLEPASCAYIADNPAKDFAAPHALGMKTVRIRRRLSLHASVDSGPDVDLEVTELLL